MRFWLLLALLLYDVITNASRPSNYDYMDVDGGKRHSSLDERRDWRKKVLMKSDRERGWEDRRYDHERPKYIDDMDPRMLGIMDRGHSMDMSPMAYGRRHYDDRASIRKVSAEINHEFLAVMGEEKKVHYSLHCGRQHERYEACFAGCAAVTCDNPRERLRPCYPFCEPGCICIHPYVRDDRTHKCVLPDDCSKGLKGIPDLGEDI